MIRNEWNQRLLLTIRDQWQKGFIADHQRVTFKQRLQGGATPELASGIVGIGDPDHPNLGIPLHRHRPEPDPRAERTQVQGQTLSSPSPTGQSPAVIGKSWFQEAAEATASGIPGRPGEQLCRTIAWEHRFLINCMPGRNGCTELLLAAVWIVAQGRSLNAPLQRPAQNSRGPKRDQGGAGIQQLTGAQPHPSSFLIEIAAMGRRSVAQSDYPRHHSILPSMTRR